MVEWLTNPENIELVVAFSAAAGALGIKVIKTLILTAFPQAAPILALLNPEQKQLAKVLNAANDKLHKNEDLKQYALERGLKLAAHLIKK